MSRTYSILTFDRFTGGSGKRWRREIEGRPKGDPMREAFKDAQYLADVLIANPHANMYGLYYITRATMLELTGLQREELGEALRLLQHDSFAYWDEETDMVWLREMARIQMFLPLKPNDKLIKPVNQWYRTCRRNPFLGPFFDRYAVDLHLEARRDFAGERLQTLPLEPAPAPAAAPAAAEPSPMHQWFLMFVEAFPASRRVGGLSGFQAFRRAFAGIEDREAHMALLLDALWYQTRSDEWRQGIIPSMVKWLDEQHWLRHHRRPAGTFGGETGMGCEHGCANAGEHALRVELDKTCRHEPRCASFFDHYQASAAAVSS